MSSAEDQLDPSSFSKHVAWYGEYARKAERVLCQRNITTALASLVGRERRRRRGRPGPRGIRAFKESESESESAHGPGKPIKGCATSGRTRGQVIESAIRAITPVDPIDTQQDMVLRIDVRSLDAKADKDVLAAAAAAADDNVAVREKAEKRTKLPPVTCKCEMTIWHVESATTITGKAQAANHAQLLRDSQLCTIRRFEAHGKVCSTIELEELFFVKASKLFVPVKLDGATRYTLDETYRLQVSLVPINCGGDGDGDDDQDWPPTPVDRLREKLPNKTPLETARRTLRLDGSMEGFLSTPVGGSPLDVKLRGACPAGTGRTFQMGTGLTVQVEALWTDPRRARHPERTTPAATKRPKQAPPCRIEYRLPGLRVHSTTGYLCPFCVDRDLRSERLLQFHLVTNHDLFGFRFTSSRDDGATLGSDTLRAIVVEVNLRPDKLVEDDIGAVERWAWVNPSGRPFSFAEYVNGDESWIYGARVESPSREVVMKDASSDVDMDLADHGLSPPRHAPDPYTNETLAPPVSEPRSLPYEYSPRASGQAESAEAPSTQKPLALAVRTVRNKTPRRRFVVPAPPSEEVRFFRSKTKRVVQEGELLSESDADVDVDESWLEHRHERTLDALPELSDAEKAFAKMWDAHVLHDRVRANIFVPAVLTRFAEANKDRLGHRHMSVEFFKHASSLVVSGCVSRDVVLNCVGIIRQAQQAAPGPEADSPLKREGHS